MYSGKIPSAFAQSVRASFPTGLRWRRTPSRALLQILLGLGLLMCVGTAGAQPEGSWDRAFVPMGLDGPTNYDGQGFCLGEHLDDLYVGGWFQRAGDVDALNIARWDGTRWHALDGGIDGTPKVIYEWGSAVVVGGNFNTVDGVTRDHIANWEGGAWHTMPGVVRPVETICTHGASLYIGGDLWDGDPEHYTSPFYRWAGTAFTSEGCPSWNLGSDNLSMTSYAGMIVVGGGFIVTQAVPDANNIVGYDFEGDPIKWIGFGDGVDGTVYDMEQIGVTLYVAGTFQHVDGAESWGLALMSSGGTFTPVEDASTYRNVWNICEMNESLRVMTQYEVYKYHGMSGWSGPLGGAAFESQLHDIFAIGDDLYVAGLFSNGIARWDESEEEWVHLGGGIGQRNHEQNQIMTLGDYDGRIIAGGSFYLPDFLEDQDNCKDIAQWHHDAWHRMGGGLDGHPRALAVFGDDLIVGGEFNNAFNDDGYIGTGKIAAWDGETWRNIGDASNNVYALTVHDGELIAAGAFTSIGGVAANQIAAWDGIQWRSLGDGLDATVYALQSFGDDLYVAGRFTTAGGVPAERVARWDGSAWHALGDGLDNYVWALASFQGEIYAGGWFTASGETPLHSLARWDGSSWQDVDGGVSGETMFYNISALQGTESYLFVGGDFDVAGGTTASALAAYDGTDWYEVGEGLHEGYQRDSANALHVVDGDLWVGGDFTLAGTRTSYNIAHWEDGTLVPTLLGAFDAVQLSGFAAPTVELSWRLAATTSAQDLQVLGKIGSVTWEVPLATTSDGVHFEVRDTNPGLGGAERVDYELRVRQADTTWQTLATTSVSLSTPRAPLLLPAVPNPFNPAVRLAFVLNEPQEVELAIHDLTGRRVATLIKDRLPAGRHQRTWRGVDDGGQQLASGTYLLRLVTDSTVQSQKLVLVR